MICLPRKTPFILGTAQLGITYGIANSSGEPDDLQAATILNQAINDGVTVFDTASSYGNSEERIGNLIKDLPNDQLSIITKVIPSFESSSDLITAVDESCKKLSVGKLFGVLSHRYDGIDSLMLQDAFENLKSADKCQYTGVSVYSGEEALRALGLKHVDLVQMPLNVLDRQAVSMRVIEYAKTLGKMLMFRSVYLQGFLLLEPDNLAGDMSFGREILCHWRQICASYSVTPQQAALSIANKLSNGFPLVIGCETKEQVQENIQMLTASIDCIDALVAETQALALRTPEQLRNPSTWHNKV